MAFPAYYSELAYNNTHSRLGDNPCSWDVPSWPQEEPYSYNLQWGNCSDFSWFNSQSYEVTQWPRQAGNIPSSYEILIEPKQPSLEETLQELMQINIINQQMLQDIQQTCPSMLIEPKKPTLEETMQQLAQNQMEFQKANVHMLQAIYETNKEQKVIAEAIAKLEVQVGNIAAALNKAEEGRVPSQPIAHPMEDDEIRIGKFEKHKHVMAVITLRSGKFDIPLLEAIQQDPTFAQGLKDLCTNKRRLVYQENVFHLKAVYLKNDARQSNRPSHWKKLKRRRLRIIVKPEWKIGNSHVSRLFAAGISRKLLFWIYQVTLMEETSPSLNEYGGVFSNRKKIIFACPRVHICYLHTRDVS